MRHQPLPPDMFDELCPSSLVPFRFGDKWAALVIRCLEDGPRRFSELRVPLAPCHPEGARAVATRPGAGRARVAYRAQAVRPAGPPPDRSGQPGLTPAGRTADMARHAARGDPGVQGDGGRAATHRAACSLPANS